MEIQQSLSPFSSRFPSPAVLSRDRERGQSRGPDWEQLRFWRVFSFPSWFDIWFIIFHISFECIQTHRIRTDLVLRHLCQLLALTGEGDWLPNTLKGRYYWDPLETGSKDTTCKGAHSSPLCSYSRRHCSWLKTRFSCLGFLAAGRGIRFETCRICSVLGDFWCLSASLDALRAVTLAGSLSAGTFKLTLSCNCRHFSWWPLRFHWWSSEFLLPVLSCPVLPMKVTSHDLLFTVCPLISWKGVKIRTRDKKMRHLNKKISNKTPAIFSIGRPRQHSGETT